MMMAQVLPNGLLLSQRPQVSFNPSYPFPFQLDCLAPGPWCLLLLDLSHRIGRLLHGRDHHLVRDAELCYIRYPSLYRWLSLSLFLRYEALILFLWYFAYVGFMKFNESVEDNLRSCLKLPKVVSWPRLSCPLLFLKKRADRPAEWGLLDHPNLLFRPEYGCMCGKQVVSLALFCQYCYRTLCSREQSSVRSRGDTWI